MQSFRIEQETLQSLRKLFEKSFEIQREVGGVFEHENVSEDGSSCEIVGANKKRLVHDEESSQSVRIIIDVDEEDTVTDLDTGVVVLKLPTQKKQVMGRKTEGYTLCEGTY